jgi:hypothetical protein
MEAATHTSVHMLPEAVAQSSTEIFPVLTNDFVHFVVHIAANSTGLRCEMCGTKGPIRYA